MGILNARPKFEPGEELHWKAAANAVTGIEIVDRDGADVFAGGMRDRLGIRTEDGVEVFVVNHLEKKMVELRELLLRP